MSAPVMTAFERVITTVEATGSLVTGTGRQRMAQCVNPDHEDRDPSLHITQGTDRVLLYCHGCQDSDSILAALGLTPADLFDGDRQQERLTRRRIVAVYDYTDESGQLLYTKLRFQPKSFAVRRPDGHGGWIWGMGSDTRRVLYRLPRIVGSGPGDVTWIAEGEKDVQALEAAGQLATCNFDGASGSGERPKWRAEYSPFMVGRHVRIVADRDEEGRAHAEYIALCLTGIAATVEVVEAAQGKDAADHFGAGLGIDGFVRWSR